MSKYTSITIIFNPNSTGNGRRHAEQLRDGLLNKDSTLPITIKATKHAGHAEELAYEHALATKKPLVISASGDGGYHEVVNGIIKAQREGAKAVAGLLPAGNANDHYKSLHTSDIVKSILRQKKRRIDLLLLKTTHNNRPFERYAHSYIGIGLTPQVGQELNKRKLNWFNEIVIVLRVLLFLRPVHILVRGKLRSYDSVVFSNINKMSKVLTLSKESSARDGKFEMTAFRRRSKLKLIGALIHSSTLGLKGNRQLRSYKFQTVKPTLVQMDGEVTTIDSDSVVKISVEHKALTCIL